MQRQRNEMIDVTLFNIRRERRCEFIGEGMRWDDLMRWRAMDQLLTTKYIPEGFNFWDEAYDDYVAMKNDKGEPKYKIVSDGSSTANMSAKELGKYVRPYSIVKANNAVFDGYTFAKAYYLYPGADTANGAFVSGPFSQQFCALPESILAKQNKRTCYRIIVFQ